MGGWNPNKCGQEDLWEKYEPRETSTCSGDVQ